MWRCWFRYTSCYFVNKQLYVIIFKLTQVNKFYAVALQIEDYYSASSSTPMSSVPIQFLFYSYHTPSGCNIPPAIISAYSNGACIRTLISSNVTKYVNAQVFCKGKNMTDFVTSSPIGMKKVKLCISVKQLYFMYFLHHGFLDIRIILPLIVLNFYPSY
jgi:hypothetical protein